eukprot:CAMPEP_0194588970 /NCGR_PEP_ID=MMETSP0292-20121207/20237_1 /TAXON_ID=39354 /ORGANISM="Heterosigma akashiwo, Strain CCMP2393" /LENGTH=156 /DNA_ID=CAMNT_0039445855 /DNA_START=105 /DNA_END=576 /DNA_ORIENTATION=+
MAQSHVLIHWMTSPRGASRRSVDGEDHSGQEMHEWVQSTMAALLVEDVLTQETISKMLAGTMAWDACPYLAPGRLNGVGVGAISSNKFVGVHHSGVLVVALAITVPPVVLPLAEFGLVDLHDHSRSSNGLAVVNEVNLDNLSAEVAPVTYSCTAMA